MISFIISAAPLEVYVFPERIKPLIHHKMPSECGNGYSPGDQDGIL
jgi:hypothetical protein